MNASPVAKQPDQEPKANSHPDHSLKHQISDAEWRVMHEVWQEPTVTSQQMIERLQETMDWSAGTIKTLLHRLVQKGALDFQRKGNRYLYRALVSEANCIDLASNQMLHTIFKGRPVPMLAYMVQSARLSGDEVKSLRSLLRQIEAELPE
jgi:BlaI family penicillinase repressor